LEAWLVRAHINDMNLSLKNIAALVALSSFAFLVGCAAEPASTNDTADTAAAVTTSNDANPNQLTVVAIAKVKPGTEADFEKAAELLVEGTRKEPGNLGDVLHRSKTDPTEFLFYETWRSAGDSDAHMKGAVLGTFFDHVKDEFEPGYPQLSQYEVVNGKSEN
jgi:quinol monooxygenase YgiN